VTAPAAPAGSLAAASHADGLSALRVGLAMVRRRPALALATLILTAVQGALQGALVYALREVLMGFDRQGQVGIGALLVGALFRPGRDPFADDGDHHQHLDHGEARQGADPDGTHARLLVPRAGSKPRASSKIGLARRPL
jgi:hypothetical protein